MIENIDLIIMHDVNPNLNQDNLHNLDALIVNHIRTPLTLGTN